MRHDEQAFACSSRLLECGRWSVDGRAERAAWTPCIRPQSCGAYQPGEIRLGEPAGSYPGHVDMHRARELVKNRWLLTIGDSTARFFFAAMLSAVNGSARQRGLPLHTLPASDECSFERKGWVTAPRSVHDAECMHRWRGACVGYSKSVSNSSSGCVLDIHLHGARHSFVWSTYLADEGAAAAATIDAVEQLAAQRTPSGTAPIVFHAGGCTWLGLEHLQKPRRASARGRMSPV